MSQEISKIVALFRQLIVNPSGFWSDVDSWTDVRLRKVKVFLAMEILCSAAATFAHELMKGPQFYAVYAILLSLSEIVTFVLFYLISMWCINYFFPLFGAESDKKTTRQLTLFCIIIPVTVNLLVKIIPFIYPVQILSFYSCYLFWTGIKTLVVFPADSRRKSCFWVTLAAILVIFTVMFIALAKIVALLY